MLRKGTSASPAVALASSVLPVPGGPDRMAPCKYSEGGEGQKVGIVADLASISKCTLASVNVASCTPFRLAQRPAHLGYLGTQVLVLFRVLEKVHKLHNLQLSLLTPGHITVPQRTGRPTHQSVTSNLVLPLKRHKSSHLNLVLMLVSLLIILAVDWLTPKMP